MAAFLVVTILKSVKLILELYDSVFVLQWLAKFEIEGYYDELR